MTEKDLAELEKLAMAATKGPWFAQGGTVQAKDGYMCELSCPRGAEQRDKDRDFIAAAREAVPALIAEIKRLREALKPIYELAQKSGCGDGYCAIWKPKGMHTNGGCACVRTASYDISLRATIEQLLRLSQDAARAALKENGNG